MDIQLRLFGLYEIYEIVLFRTVKQVFSTVQEQEFGIQEFV